MENGCSCAIPSELRRKCNDNALVSHGKSYVFEQRSHIFHRRLVILKWLGIAVPLLVYALITRFQMGEEFQKIIVTFASIFSTLLLILSSWSMAADWEKQYSKSLLAQMDFSELGRRYKELGDTSLLSLDECKSEINRLDSLLEKADQLAMELKISDAEKRMGLRSGLREYQRKCVKCDKVPYDLRPTDCPVCGQYNKRRF